MEEQASSRRAVYYRWVRTCLAGEEYCRRFCPLLISGDFNLRRRSSAASLDLSLSLGDPPVDEAGEAGVRAAGGARDPIEAIRRAVPMRGVPRGDGGTGSGGGSW